MVIMQNYFSQRNLLVYWTVITSISHIANIILALRFYQSGLSAVFISLLLLVNFLWMCFRLSLKKYYRSNLRTNWKHLCISCQIHWLLFFCFFAFFLLSVRIPSDFFIWPCVSFMLFLFYNLLLDAFFLIHPDDVEDQLLA